MTMLSVGSGVPDAATTKVEPPSVHRGAVAPVAGAIAVTAQVSASGCPEAVVKPEIETGATLMVCEENRSLLVVNPCVTATGGALETTSE